MVYYYYDMVKSRVRFQFEAPTRPYSSVVECQLGTLDVLSPILSGGATLLVATMEHRKTFKFAMRKGPAMKSWAALDSSAIEATCGIA